MSTDVTCPLNGFGCDWNGGPSVNDPLRIEYRAHLRTHAVDDFVNAVEALVEKVQALSSENFAVRDEIADLVLGLKVIRQTVTDVEAGRIRHAGQ